MFSKNNKNGLTASMMDEMFGIEEVEEILDSNSEQIRGSDKIVLTLLSSKDEVLASLDELEIPYHDKTIEQVLTFLFDRLLYEYMEHQSYYTKESYSEFKTTFMYDQLQILIYHVKFTMLNLYDNGVHQIPRHYKFLYRMKDINPVEKTNYLEIYERFKMYMEFVTPYRLAKYFNYLVGLKHDSVRTKAIYHAFVEELEKRVVNQDGMLYSNESMLIYYADIVSQANKLFVVKI